MGSAWDRVIGVAAGLVGAAGVAASAAGSHAYAGTNLGIAGTMLLIHGAALLALARPGLNSNRVRRLAAAVLAIGVTLFSGDLAMRAIEVHPLFPMAAPLGGLMLIAGWIVASVSFVGGQGSA